MPVGPNERNVSVHELILAARSILSPRVRRARRAQCEIKTNTFPDGTPWHLTNEASWDRARIRWQAGR